MDNETGRSDARCRVGSLGRSKFRIYGRPMPGNGDMIALPVDGRLISARVTVRSQKLEMEQSAEAELVELIE